MLENDYCSKLIILSVLSISLLKNNTLIPEIRSIALNKLDEVCSQIREYGKIDIEDINEINLDELENELQGQPVKIEYMLKIIKHLKTLNDNMVNIYNNQEILCSSIDAYKEETNILSWLIGETSNDLHKKLDKKIMQREVAFILGKELADLVLIIPGPYSAKGILNKMVGLCKAESKTLSLVDMVDLIDTNWKVSLLKKYPDSAYFSNTPIILAIAKSLEVDGDKVWKYTYGKIMGFDPEMVTQDMLTWGYQIYLECLLVKLSEEYNG